MNILPETYLKLSRISNIVAAKEASGNFSQMAKISALCGDDLTLYSGNDDQITSALAIGAKGVISVLANIVPEATHDICQSYFDGDSARSDTLQLTYLELIENLFRDVNPIPVKQAMNNMGFEVGVPAALVRYGRRQRQEQLLACMARYGLAQPGKRIGTVTVKRAPDTLLWRKNH